jgi:hypothetical protein
MKLFPSFTTLPSILVAGAIASPAMAAENIKLRFSACAIALAEDQSELHLPLGTGSSPGAISWMKVGLNELTVGDEIEYTGPATLQFYATPDPAGKPLASITLEPASGSLLLVFLPDQASGGYKIIPIPDAGFPYGSYFFQNLSPHPVAIVLGEKQQVLRPGENKVQTANAGQDEEVKIHASINGNSRLIKSSSWRLDAGQRELVFFHSPPGSSIVSTKHVVSTQPEAGR